jgi:photosystem II stability/assembly factor-like uncharacterized protein/predicted esterase
MSRLVIVIASVVVASACGGTDPVNEPDAGGDPTCNVPRGTQHGQKLAQGDGQEDRFFWLHVPASYRCDAPSPLLVDFHGTASDVPEEAYQTDALIAFADANGVIVARPRSRSSDIGGGVQIYRWDENPGDVPRNVLFAKNLVKDLSVRYSIDPARVYASGFSSGSNMVAQFLLDPASPFKGIAPIAGGKWTPETLPSLADGPRVWMATGYRDYLWPYARSLLGELATAGLPSDRVVIRHTGGGHDLYPWHFDELWQFLDQGVRPGGGTVAAPWTIATLPSPSDVNALALDGTTLVAAGAHSRVWRRDAAGSWALELDRGTADYTTLCFGATRAFVGGDNTAVHRTGTTWNADQGVPDFGMLGAGWVNGAACRDDGSIVVGGYWSAAITSDGGAHWTRFRAPTTFSTEIDQQVAGAVEAPGGATVLVGYYDYVGTAGRGTIVADPRLHTTTSEWWNAATAVAGGKFWAVGDNGAIVASADNGVTWTPQTSGTVENLYAVHFADASHGAAVGRRGAIVVTSDGGAHWTPRPLGKDIFVGAVFVDATTITIAGETGLVATSLR